MASSHAVSEMELLSGASASLLFAGLSEDSSSTSEQVSVPTEEDIADLLIDDLVLSIEAEFAPSAPSDSPFIGTISKQDVHSQVAGESFDVAAVRKTSRPFGSDSRVSRAGPVQSHSSQYELVPKLDALRRPSHLDDVLDEAAAFGLMLERPNMEIIQRVNSSHRHLIHSLQPRFGRRAALQPLARLLRMDRASLAETFSELPEQCFNDVVAQIYGTLCDHAQNDTIFPIHISIPSSQASSVASNSRKSTQRASMMNAGHTLNDGTARFCRTLSDQTQSDIDTPTHISVSSTQALSDEVAHICATLFDHAQNDTILPMQNSIPSSQASSVASNSKKCKQRASMMDAGRTFNDGAARFCRTLFDQAQNDIDTPSVSSSQALSDEVAHICATLFDHAENDIDTPAHISAPCSQASSVASNSEKDQCNANQIFKDVAAQFCRTILSQAQNDIDTPTNLSVPSSQASSMLATSEIYQCAQRSSRINVEQIFKDVAAQFCRTLLSQAQNDIDTPTHISVPSSQASSMTSNLEERQCAQHASRMNADRMPGHPLSLLGAVSSFSRSSSDDQLEDLLARLFDIIDLNQDGTISRAEFQQALSKGILVPCEAGADTVVSDDNNVESLDVGASGTSELIGMSNSLHEDAREKLDVLLPTTQTSLGTTCASLEGSYDHTQNDSRSICLSPISDISEPAPIRSESAPSSHSDACSTIASIPTSAILSSCAESAIADRICEMEASFLVRSAIELIENSDVTSAVVSSCAESFIGRLRDTIDIVGSDCTAEQCASGSDEPVHCIVEIPAEVEQSSASQLSTEPSLPIEGDVVSEALLRALPSDSHSSRADQDAVFRNDEEQHPLLKRLRPGSEIGSEGHITETSTGLNCKDELAIDAPPMLSDRKRVDWEYECSEEADLQKSCPPSLPPRISTPIECINENVERSEVHKELPPSISQAKRTLSSPARTASRLKSQRFKSRVDAYLKFVKKSKSGMASDPTSLLDSSALQEASSLQSAEGSCEIGDDPIDSDWLRESEQETAVMSDCRQDGFSFLEDSEHMGMPWKESLESGTHAVSRTGVSNKDRCQFSSAVVEQDFDPMSRDRPALLQAQAKETVKSCLATEGNEDARNSRRACQGKRQTEEAFTYSTEFMRFTERRSPSVLKARRQAHERVRLFTDIREIRKLSSSCSRAQSPVTERPSVLPGLGAKAEIEAKRALRITYHRVVSPPPVYQETRAEKLEEKVEEAAHRQHYHPRKKDARHQHLRATYTSIPASISAVNDTGGGYRSGEPRRSSSVADEFRRSKRHHRLASPASGASILRSSSTPLPPLVQTTLAFPPNGVAEMDSRDHNSGSSPTSGRCRSPPRGIELLQLLQKGALPQTICCPA